MSPVQKRRRRRSARARVREEIQIANRYGYRSVFVAPETSAALGLRPLNRLLHRHGFGDALPTSGRGWLAAFRMFEAREAA